MKDIAINSILSDYKTLFSELFIPAGIAGIQIPWMDLSLPSMAQDARFPAGMTNSRII